VLAASVLLATAIAATSASASGGDLSGGPLVDLGPSSQSPVADATPPAGVDPSGADDGGDDGFAGPDDGQDPSVDTTGTDDELQLRRARLVAERNQVQELLTHQEGLRREAEARHDDALAAISARLVELLDQGADDRLRAVLEARDAVDDEARDATRAALDPADRLLVDELDAAAAVVAAIGRRADATRARVLALGTSVAALDAEIESRAGPSAADRARAAGKRHSIDADYVFATGPIPGIGYWGAVSGGGMLTGWMGYAGAAMGGIGCTPPDPALRASGTIEMGEASWYGPGFQGRNTASGEVFDTNEMTAAHRTLPFGTIVRVYSSSTARCAFVRINDRGPFIDGRVIDLSRAAADAIGMESVAPVQLEVYAEA
jgi:rare lipoprotein A